MKDSAKQWSWGEGLPPFSSEQVWGTLWVYVDAKKVVYSLGLQRLQLPESGQVGSIRLCTKGWVRQGGVDMLRTKAGSAAYHLCDLRQVTSPPLCRGANDSACCWED